MIERRQAIGQGKVWVSSGDPLGRLLLADAAAGNKVAEQACRDERLTGLWLRQRIESGDREAHAVFVREASRSFGEDPLRAGALEWPDGLSSIDVDPRDPGLVLERHNAIEAWRWWSVYRDGSLRGPYMTRQGSNRHPGVTQRWLSGWNRASRDDCLIKTGNHPVPACTCGIRGVQSLTVLDAYLNGLPGDVRAPVVAVAKIRLWGRIAGPAYGDDFPFTVRGEWAQIAGPVYLSDSCSESAAAYITESLRVDLGADDDVRAHVRALRGSSRRPGLRLSAPAARR